LLNKTENPTRRVTRVVKNIQELNSSEFIEENLKPFEPEECDTQTIYTITLNPKDAYQYLLKPDRVKSFNKSIQELIQTIRFTCSIEANLEISRGGRLHIHGNIQIHEPMNFFINSVPQLLDYGHLTIGHMPHPDVWDKYSTKQQTCMEQEDYPCLFKTIHTPPPIGNGKEEIIEVPIKTKRKPKK